MKNKIILEFNGMPGCGKSTIISHLKNNNSNLIRDINDIKVSYNIFFNFFFKIYISFKSLFLFLSIRKKKPTEYWSLFKFIYTHKSTWFYLNKMDQGFFIIDEGTIQKSLSIIKRTDLELENLKMFYDLLKKDINSNIVEILIEASKEKIFKRRVIRNKPQDYNVHKLQDLDEDLKLFNTTRKKILINSDFILLRNNSKADLDYNIKLLSSFF